MSDQRWTRLTKAQQRSLIARHGKDSPLVRDMRGLPPLREPEVEMRIQGGKPTVVRKRKGKR